MKRTLTTTLMALLLCVCMILGLTACGGFTQDDIDNAVNEATSPLNEQIAALEADIAEKEAKITALEGEKTALTTEKTELITDIEEIEAEVTALETEKATLEAEVAALEEEKASLTSDKADLEEQITTLNGTIATKNNEIATLNSSISALNAEKANLTARVTELEASITAKDTEIAGLNSSVATLTAEKQALTDRVAELEAENAGLRNCLKDEHVVDETKTISYVYTWSETEPTSTQSYTCLHCEKAVEEKVLPSVWQVGDTVTYIANDGNPYACVVSEETTVDNLVLRSETYFIANNVRVGDSNRVGSFVKDYVTAKGARLPAATSVDIYEYVFTDSFIHSTLMAALTPTNATAYAVNFTIANNKYPFYCRYVDWNETFGALTSNVSNKDVYYFLMWDIALETAE